MAPHGDRDLIELLDLPGTWAESSELFVKYFAELRRPAEDRDWALLSRMLRDQIDEPYRESDEVLRAKVVAELGPVRSRPVLRLHEPPSPTRYRVLGWKPKQVELVTELWLTRQCAIGFSGTHGERCAATGTRAAARRPRYPAAGYTRRVHRAVRR